MPIPPAIAIIQARMSSSRLPGKVLKPLAGHPMIWHIVQRARVCVHVDQVIVATSTEASDDPLAEFCANHDIACHRGSLNNVLSRYLDLLEQYPHAYCVRITGDCPLIDPDFIDRQILALTAHDGDHLWLSGPAPVLAGAGTHSARALRFVGEHSQHPDDLEHVGARYFAEHPECFRIIGMHPPEKLSTASGRVTVDEASDYAMMQLLYNALWQGAPIPLSAVLDWMERHPEQAGVNQAVQHSAINQEVHAKIRTWAQHVHTFCAWENPQTILASGDPAYS